MRHKITVLVNSSDGYSDLWSIFFELLKKYWPNCNYRIILNTESKTYTYQGLNIECFQFYSEGENVPYGKRIIRHLEEISTEYTLMLLDDFFLRDFVKVDRILECLHWMEVDKNIVTFQFSPLVDKNNVISCQYNDFEKRPIYGNYKLCFSPALWRTAKLKDYWREHENPWQWEEIGNIRTVNYKQDEFYAICENSSPIINYGYNKERCWGVVQGKWAKENVDDFFKKNGINIDYSERGIFSEDDRSRLCKQPYWKKWICEYKSLKNTGLGIRFFIYKIRRLFQTICKMPVEEWQSYFFRKETCEEKN